jgi:peptidoglycan hydrolase-like protein with peptidoglycan-binding domain
MRRRWLGWAVLPMLVVAVAIGAFVATTRLVPVEIAPLQTPESPVVAKPRMASSRLARPANLSFWIRNGSQMSVMGATAPVTAIDVAPMMPISEGDRVVRLGNTWAVAMFSSSPQWRTLRRGDRGPDVESLQTFLQAVVDSELPVDGEYSAATESAVNELQRRIGIDRPTGLSEPAFYAWSDSDPFVLGSVVVSVGSVGGGQLVVGVGAPAIDDQAISGAEALPMGATVIVLEDGATLPLDEVDGTLKASDADLLGLPEVDDALSQLAATDSQQLSINGSVQLSDPIDVIEVPASAIEQGPDGSTCVWTRQGDGWDAVAVSVVAYSANGVPQLTNLAYAGLDVLVNPERILNQPQCP